MVKYFILLKMLVLHHALMAAGAKHFLKSDFGRFWSPTEVTGALMAALAHGLLIYMGLRVDTTL